MVETVYRAFDGTDFESYDVALEYENEKKPKERWIRFSGHSDDIVMVDQGDGCGFDEFYKRNFILEDLDRNGCRVEAVYNGCWGFAVLPLEEDVPSNILDMDITMEGYTAKLSLLVTTGTVFTET